MRWKEQSGTKTHQGQLTQFCGISNSSELDNIQKNHLVHSSISQMKRD